MTRVLPLPMVTSSWPPMSLNNFVVALAVMYLLARDYYGPHTL